MNILVTGGAGFIGSHLTDLLLEDGHTVIVADNLSTGVREHVHGDAEFVEMDICDEDKVTQLFDSHAIDAVFHEAAQTMVPYSMEHPREDAKENIMGLLNVLENCRRHDVQKVVFSSSAAVYGDNEAVPIAETAPVLPTSFYGLTKATAEQYLKLYHEAYSLPYVVLRYSNVYGQRQGTKGEGGVVCLFAKHLAKGQPLTIYGDGEQSRDFVFVKDVARANIAALGQDVTPGVYNISTKIETTVNALKEIFIYFANFRPDVTYKEARPGDIYRSALDNTKARELLHWVPKTKLLPGLMETFDYFLREG